MDELHEKVALVTGASRGIGRGVAIGLARQGAKVAITARTMSADEAPQLSGGAEPSTRPVPGSLSETLAELQQIQAGSIAIPADLAERDNVERVVRQTMDAFGRLDILVNCAMGFPGDYEGEAFWKSGVADWDLQNNVGCRSHYLAGYFAAPHMVAQGSGLIVNVSTAGAIHDYYNVGFRVAHAANTRLAKAMAHDLKPHGVAAIALWPRWVLTERVKLAAENAHPGFTVDPDELADADSPEIIGEAISKLAVDPNLMARSGRIHLIAEMLEAYCLTETDGRKPRIDDFTRQLRKEVDQIEAVFDW